MHDCDISVPDATSLKGLLGRVRRCRLVDTLERLMQNEFPVRYCCSGHQWGVCGSLFDVWHRIFEATFLATASNFSFCLVVVILLILSATFARSGCPYPPEGMYIVDLYEPLIDFWSPRFSGYMPFRRNKKLPDVYTGSLSV